MKPRHRAFLLTALSLIAAPHAAQASRATLLIMGTGDGGVGALGSGDGSLYYEDPYNTFYNPAYVNTFHDWVTVERENGAGATGAANAPQAGLMGTLFSFSYGVYFNRAGAVLGLNDDGITSGGAATAQAYPAAGAGGPVRPVEAFFGTEFGPDTRVGASIAYAGNDGTSGTSTDLSISAGGQFGMLEPFGSLKVIGRGPTGDHQAWRLGTRIRFGEWIPYAVAFSAADTGAAGTVRALTVGGGIGRSTRIGENVRINTALSYWNISGENPAASALSAGFHRNVVPIDLSAEAELTTWLTIRSGFTFRVLDRLLSPGAASEVTVSAATTSARVGGSFHVGKFDLDLAIGNGAGTGLDRFLTAVSLTYRI